MQPNTNAEQIDYWNGEAGAMWAKRQDHFPPAILPQ